MTIRPFLPLLPLAAVAVLAACIPAAPPEPEPAPPPVIPDPQPSQAPEEVVTPVYDDWMDAPQTPGDWTYRAVPEGSAAFFAQPPAEALFAFRCDRNARAVSLVRGGSATGPVQMTIRSETRDRTLTASPTGEQLPTIRAVVSSQDPLLDAIAFSKGRFAVEVDGMRTLYLPAWPEITRVIEDCR